MIKLFFLDSIISVQFFDVVFSSSFFLLNRLVFVNLLTYARSTFVLLFSIFSEDVNCIMEIVQYTIQVTRAGSKKEFNLVIFSGMKCWRN